MESAIREEHDDLTPAEKKRKLTCEAAIGALRRQAEWFEITPTIEKLEARIAQVKLYPLGCWHEYEADMVNMRDLVITRLSQQLEMFYMQQPLWTRFKRWLRWAYNLHRTVS